MARILSKLMTGRRITLPEEWCETQDVKIGDIVAVDYVKDSISVTVTAVEVKPKK